MTGIPGGFVGLQGRAQVASSSDGAHWQVHDTGSQLTLRRVAFALQTVLALGDGGTILQSNPFVPAITSIRVAGQNQLELEVLSEADRQLTIQASPEMTAWSAQLTVTNAPERTVLSLTNAGPSFYRVKVD